MPITCTLKILQIKISKKKKNVDLIVIIFTAALLLLSLRLDAFWKCGFGG